MLQRENHVSVKTVISLQFVDMLLTKKILTYCTSKMSERKVKNIHQKFPRIMNESLKTD